APIARGIGRRQRIGPAAVANDARSRHRLVSAAVDVYRVLAHAGRDVEVVELREACAARRAGAELETGNVHQRIRVAHDRGFEVNRGKGVGGARLDEVILGKEGERAVYILPRRDPSPETQIAHIAEDGGDLRAGPRV